MTAHDIPEFGNKVAGVHYVLRPGAYAVVRNEEGQIAIVRTPKGYFLPGGGQEADESPEQAAIRETREECGLHIEINERLGVADELTFAASKNIYFRKRSTFFTASVIGLEGEGEEDHELLWLSPYAAASRLNHGSQVWAVVRL